MKKSLVAGVSALVLSFVALTGCAVNNSSSNDKTSSQVTDTQTESNNETNTESKPVETPVATVAEINQRDESVTDKAVSVKHGQKVKVENVEVLASYEHYMYVHQVVSNDDGMVTLAEIALEVHSDTADLREFTTSCLINVEGTIDTLNDRFIMKDAVVEVVKENPTGEPKNLFIYPEFDRSTTIFATRFLNGLGTVTTLQVAEDVGEITEAGKTIKVAFPGEDLTISEDNYNLFDFIIPAGLSKYELDFINANRYGGLKVGNCFETLAALQYNNGTWNFVYLPYIGANPDYIGGRARSPMSYSTFGELKDQFLPDLIKADKIAGFPNLTTVKEGSSESLVYSYLPDDMLFTEEGEYSLYISINSYDLETAVAQINEQIRTQGYVGGNETTDETGVIKSYTWVSDKTDAPDYTVTIENAADVVAGVLIKANKSVAKEEQILFDSNDYENSFDAIKAQLNKSVDKISRRYSVLLPQYDGFQSQLQDIRPLMTKVGLKPTNVVLNRTNETVYGGDGFLPIIQERLHFNFDYDKKPEIIGEGEAARLKYPGEVVDNYFRVVKELSYLLKDNGFVYTQNELLYQLGPNGEKLPVYGYFNPETSEMIMTDLRSPMFNQETKTWEGEWSFLIFDEIIHDALGFRMKAVPNEEPMYKLPENFNEWFKKTTGCTGDFVGPEFDAWEMLVGTEKGNDKVVKILMAADVEDPIASYKATLEKAGFTITSSKKTIPAQGEEPAREVTVYKATKEGSDVVIEFSFDKKVLEITAYKAA